MLTTERDAIGQNEVTKAIGRIAHRLDSIPRAVAILILALDSRDWVVRRGAAQVAGLSSCSETPARRGIVKPGAQALGLDPLLNSSFPRPQRRDLTRGFNPAQPRTRASPCE
jgi:hypothetical protein